MSQLTVAVFRRRWLSLSSHVWCSPSAEKSTLPNYQDHNLKAEYVASSAEYQWPPFSFDFWILLILRYRQKCKLLHMLRYTVFVYLLFLHLASCSLHLSLLLTPSALCQQFEIFGTLTELGQRHVSCHTEFEHRLFVLCVIHSLIMFHLLTTSLLSVLSVIPGLLANDALCWALMDFFLISWLIDASFCRPPPFGSSTLNIQLGLARWMVVWTYAMAVNAVVIGTSWSLSTSICLPSSLAVVTTVPMLLTNVVVLVWLSVFQQLWSSLIFKLPVFRPKKRGDVLYFMTS